MFTISNIRNFMLTSSSLLPPFEDPDTTVSPNMIQILLFLNLHLAATVSATRYSDHTTHVLRNAGIKQSETDNHPRLMRQ